MEKVDLLITLTADKADENNVTIAFVMGLKALEKGYSVRLLLLSNGVRLANKSYADEIDIGEPFPPIKDVYPAFFEKGGLLSVCDACMKHNNVLPETVVKEAQIIQAPDVIDALMNSDKTLQLN
ncbi:MAG: hypothetical protein GX239_08070 [Clostridiaceae bacterium]|nr:hypothetical protein [Clostridiaceae bacterium]